jgi:hypothetical protein
MDIAFNSTTLSNQVFSNKQSNFFYFKGRNHSDKELTVKGTTVNCGCTEFIVPEKIEPNSEFTVTIKINKDNQTGIVSQSGTITFSNEEKFDFRVTGEIKV